MFRPEMSDVSLTAARSARGPRPSYKPAVEALEVRVVLSTAAGPAGLNPLEVVASRVLRSIEKIGDEALMTRTVGTSFDVSKNLKKLSRYDKLLRLLDRVSFGSVVIDNARDRLRLLRKDLTTNPPRYTPPFNNYHISDPFYDHV
jgi:hypothetical protein